MLGRNGVSVIIMGSSILVKRVGGADIATSKLTPDLMGGVHDDERAGSRIDDEIVRRGDGADQPFDEAGRFDVRVELTVDLFGPAVGMP